MMTDLGELRVAPCARKRKRSARHNPPSPRLPTKKKWRRLRRSQNRGSGPPKGSMIRVSQKETRGSKDDVRLLGRQFAHTEPEQTDGARLKRLTPGHDGVLERGIGRHRRTSCGGCVTALERGRSVLSC